MRRYVKYFSYVIRHKWFVLVEGIKLGVPIWQLLLHDWTKFLLSEAVPYARTFRTSDGKARYAPDLAFDQAWNSHQKRNKHHWQYWVLIMDSGDIVPLPMPERHRREMLADWRGAGRALGKPDTAGWYKKNREKIMLHPDTRAWVERKLGITGT